MRRHSGWGHQDSSMSEYIKNPAFEMLPQILKKLLSKRLFMAFMLCSYAIVHIQLLLLNSVSTLKENLHDMNVMESFGFTTMLPGRQSAVLCAIVKDAEFYLEEWLDYNLALGFETIYVYINEDYFYYNEKINSAYPTYYRNRVQLIHYPGEAMQIPAYNHCVKQLIEDNKTYTDDVEQNYSSVTSKRPTWVACFDTDEFLVIKKNRTLIDFLTKYCSSGAIALNWVLFGQPNTDILTIPGGIKALAKSMDEFSFLPITKRNLFRPDTPDHHVKPIVKISDFIDRDERFKSPHIPILRKGLKQHDTNFKRLKSYANEDAPTNVAVLHHYHYKSYKEYIQKRRRGQADFVSNHTSNVKLLNDAISGTYYGVNFSVYDDSAWTFLKEKLPKYAVFDSWFESAPFYS